MLAEPVAIERAERIAHEAGFERSLTNQLVKFAAAPYSHAQPRVAFLTMLHCQQSRRGV